MNEANITDILNVAGGNKEFKVSIDKESLVMLTAGFFIAMLLAFVVGGLIVKRIG